MNLHDFHILQTGYRKLLFKVFRQIKWLFIYCEFEIFPIICSFDKFTGKTECFATVFYLPFQLIRFSPFFELNCLFHLFYLSRNRKINLSPVEQLPRVFTIFKKQICLKFVYYTTFYIEFKNQRFIVLFFKSLRQFVKIKFSPVILVIIEILWFKFDNSLCNPFSLSFQ